MGTTTDIYVQQSGFFDSSELFIELKRNLQHKAQLDRLVGQIASLNPEKNAVIVVLCGVTNPALVTRFKEQFRLDNFLDFRSFKLVLKENVKRAAAK